MARSHSHNERVRNKLRNVSALQWFIVTLFFVLLTLYALGFAWQTSYAFYSVYKNSNAMQLDNDCYRIESCEAQEDGNILVSYYDGTEEVKTDYQFVFVDKSRKLYINDEEKVILVQLSDIYNWNVLLGSNFFVVYGASIVFAILLTIQRKSNWRVFSLLSIRIVSYAFVVIYTLEMLITLLIL